MKKVIKVLWEIYINAIGIIFLLEIIGHVLYEIG